MGRAELLSQHLASQGRGSVCFANCSLIACLLPTSTPLHTSKSFKARKLENFLFVVARSFHRVGFPPRRIWL